MCGLRMTRLLLAAFFPLSVTGAAAAPGGSAAADGSTVTIDISGSVPVVCRASFGVPAIVNGSGAVDLGRLTEFCNHPRGYRVFLTASESLEGVVLRIDGQRHRIRRGENLLSSSDRPNSASRSAMLELPGKSAAGSLTLRIDPFGH